MLKAGGDAFSRLAPPLALLISAADSMLCFRFARRQLRDFTGIILSDMFKASPPCPPSPSSGKSEKVSFVVLSQTECKHWNPDNFAVRCTQGDLKIKPRGGKIAIFEKLVDRASTA